MKNFFKKRKPIHEVRNPGKIASFVDKQKSRCAAWLNDKTRNYTKRRWKFILAVFVVLCGTLSATRIVTSVSGNPAPSKISRIKEIPIGRRPTLPLPDIGREVGAIESRLNELRRSSPALYDSLLKTQPGLLDSLKELRQNIK